MGNVSSIKLIDIPSGVGRKKEGESRALRCASIGCLSFRLPVVSNQCLRSFLDNSSGKWTLVVLILKGLAYVVISW